MLLCKIDDIGIDHDADEVFERGFGFPAVDAFGFGGVTDEEVDFGRTFVAGVVFDEFVPVDKGSAPLFDINWAARGRISGKDAEAIKNRIRGSDLSRHESGRSAGADF